MISSNKGTKHAADVRCLIKIVEELRKYDPQMELSQLLVYLLVLNQPGIRASDLLARTGLSRSALSRNIMALSSGEYKADNRSKGKPGHDLVTTVSDPFDARAQLVAPTQRGHWLMQKFTDCLHPKEVPNGA